MNMGLNDNRGGSFGESRPQYFFVKVPYENGGMLLLRPPVENTVNIISDNLTTSYTSLIRDSQKGKINPLGDTFYVNSSNAHG